MADKMCDNMMAKEDQLREHSGLGMKTLLSGLAGGKAGAAGPMVVQQIGPKLLDGIARAEEPLIKAELLDTLHTCLLRFGTGVPELHGGVEECLLTFLSHRNSTVRKRCTQCMAALTACASEEVFAHLITAVLSAMSTGDAGTHVQVVGGISRTVGFRLGPYVEQIVPVVFAQLEGASGEQGDVLRESCLQSLESLAKRCPVEMAPMAESALRKSMELLKYEPNLDDDYEDEGDDMEEDDEDEDEEEEDDDDDDYDDFEDDGDDDDDSWKIRRAATRCVSSIVSTRPELLDTAQTEVADLLVKRFRSEPEDNVKMDLYQAFQEILRLTKTAMNASSAPFPQAFVDANVPKVARYVVQYDFKDKSKARSNAFTMLRVLCETFPGCFDDHMERLTVGIVKTLEDKKANATLKIEGLSFVQTLIAHHVPGVFFGCLGKLMPAVFACAQDRYFKITAEALRVVAQVAKSIMASPDFDASAFVGTVYKVTLDRLSATDQDAEVKQCAITGMADIIAVLGDLLGAELGACLPILVDRLRNEVTRLTAVKAFASIAASPLNIDLSSVLGDVVNELCEFLKKADRALRQGALSTLVALASTASASGMNGQQLITEVAELISDSDLYLSQLALQVCKAMLVVFPTPECAQTLKRFVWTPTFALLQSPLLQNSGAERAAMELISQIVKVGAPGFNFEMLLPTVTGCVVGCAIGGGGAGEITRQALSSLAQCVAAMCETASPAEVTKTVDEFIAAVGQEVPVTCLSLLSLGEIGRRADLSSHGALESTVMSVLSDSSEEVKNAAAFSLGNIAVGCMDKYLSIVLGAITSNAGQQYLLLHSLKEIIKRVSEDESKAKAMTGYTATMLPLLYDNANSAEEGVRNVVAECLGKIAILEPDRLGELKAMATSGEPSIRQTVATAVRHAVSDQPNAAVDERLAADADAFLALIDDDDLGVKRAALLTLNTLIHSKQVVVRPILASLVEKVYRETVIRPELIHKVMLGPFSHIVDDGLDARKAAFECIDTLVANCIDALEPQACLTAMISGLADDYDIKMLSYLILVRPSLTPLSAADLACSSVCNCSWRSSFTLRISHALGFVMYR